jgi:hypothetical protein
VLPCSCGQYCNKLYFYLNTIGACHGLEKRYELT